MKQNMVTPELSDFVKSRLALGENIEIIRASLKQAGWADQDIEEGIKAETGTISNSQVVSAAISNSVKKSPFSPTKVKVITSIILAFFATFIAAGMIIAGADGNVPGIVYLAFIIYPATFLIAILRTILGIFAGLFGILLEAVYIYLLFSIAVALSRSKYGKIIVYSVTGLLIISIVFLSLFHNNPITKTISSSFNTSNCRGPEQTLDTPPDLAGKTILLEKDEFVAVGDPSKHDYGCTPSLSNIQNEIVGHEAIDNVTVGTRYYTEKGLTVNPLPAGKTFKIVKRISVPSSDVPLEFLVLTDEKGTSYQIAEVDLGYVDPSYNDSTAFLSYLGSDGQKHYLSDDYFTNYNTQKISDQTANISFELDKIADTTGWQFYTSAANKYQIKYPNGWKEQSPPKGIEGGDDFYSSDKGTTVSLIAFNSKYGTSVKSETQHQVTIQINGMDAVEGLRTNNFGIPIDVPYFEAAINQDVNGIYYEFTFQEKDGKNTDLPIFNAMLKSFSTK